MRRDGSFRLRADFVPQGDQPQAIAALAERVYARARATRSCSASRAAARRSRSRTSSPQVNKPTLVIAPNKTLAAQLYHEFRTFFPDNAVRYFVSYYDYYQPEAYVPSTDTYIDKDASINDEIDKMRHAATKALLERNDVLVVASVSCIYGLGSPASYFDMLVVLERDDTVERDVLLRKLVDMQYQRNDYDFHRGTFRVRGDVVEIYPAYEEGARASGSSCSATPSSRSPRSIRCAARCCGGSSAWRSIRPATTSPPRRRSRRPWTASGSS